MFKEKFLIYREGVTPQEMAIFTGIPKEDPDKKSVDKLLKAMPEYGDLKRDYDSIQQSNSSDEPIKGFSEKAKGLVLARMKQNPIFADSLTETEALFNKAIEIIGSASPTERAPIELSWTEITDKVIEKATALLKSRKIKKEEFIQIKATCELFSYSIVSISELILTEGRNSMMETISAVLPEEGNSAAEEEAERVADARFSIQEYVEFKQEYDKIRTYPNDENVRAFKEKASQLAMKAMSQNPQSAAFIGMARGLFSEIDLNMTFDQLSLKMFDEILVKTKQAMQESLKFAREDEKTKIKATFSFLDSSLMSLLELKAIMGRKS